MRWLLRFIFTLTYAQLLNGQSPLLIPLPNDLEPYLQIDDVDSGLYDEPDSLPKNSCTRPCVPGVTRLCYYRFTLEPYVVLGGACRDCLNNTSDCFSSGCVSADGFEKGILTVNRRLPGPSIQVCKGDVLIVDVKNSMPGRSTTLHWHGIRQKNFKFMDGVPMVTQCPITEGQTFRYTFKVNEPGLNFYHSHDGLQKVDGIVGSLVVRQPLDTDPNVDEYDFDLPSHVIVIQDWYHLMADDMFPGLRFNNTDQMAQTYLIKGRGQFTLENGSPSSKTPLAQFNVTQGSRYVFRVVAGTCFECQYVFTIEDHDMIIIGADARSTKPYRVDSLTMSAGERFTVVVNCAREIRSYWIQVRAMGICNHTGAHQVAVLHYNTGRDRRPTVSAPTFDDSHTNRIGLTMNPLNSACGPSEPAERGPCLHDLRGAEEAPECVRRPKPHARVIWAVGFTPISDQTLFNDTTDYIRFLQTPNGRFASTINGVSNMAPPSPLLSQPERVPDDIVCPVDGFPTNTWNTEHRSCVHIQKVPANSVVEIVVVDLENFNPRGLSHSIHLHGYDPYIIEMGEFEQGMSLDEAIADLTEYLDSDRRRQMPADLVTKDTFAVSSRGYVVARIFTDNTGYWLFHCHFAYHLDSGMSGILQVGDQDNLPSPPDGFPTCGDYSPNTTYV